jgi:predicted  nucleic acid-binding Zn-ribbon protein
MPHQCTNCGRTFADGSKEMLSGCPDCSGTKFQFRPDGFADDDAAPESTPSTPETSDSESATGPEPATDADPMPDSDPAGDTVARTVGSAAATVRDLVSGSAGPDATAASPPEADADTATTTARAGSDHSDPGDDDIIVAESEPLEGGAQADARSQFADPEEVPDSGGFDPATDDETGDATDDDDREVAAEPDREVAAEPDAEGVDRPDVSELREELNEQFESIRVVEPGQYELNLMELYDREEYIIALQEDGRYSIQMPDTWRDDDR